MHLCIERKRARAPHLFQPPACGHHSQGSLQRLAHSTLPSLVGSLPGQPFVASAVCIGGAAHGRARTPASRAAGTACPRHTLRSASALHALPRRRHHHPCSLTQCHQASWVPPRQGRQPPSGRCALGPPPPSRLPPRCCRLPACASARPPWEVLSVPALAGTRPPYPDRWTPSCLCCQPVSHCLHILHRQVLQFLFFLG